jgi:hypothetical protein
MRVSASEITTANGEAVLSAQVRFERPLLNKPERLWFSVPEAYAPFLSQRADAFAAGTILLAMHSGEDMIVEGELSPRLVRGLAEYQRAFHFWYPDRLSLVGLHTPNLCEMDAAQAGEQTATLFSGGVDSAFTLMMHLPQHQPLPEYQVRYGLFLHGFDVPLQNQTSFEDAFQTFRQELAVTGVELIPLRTNLRYFTSGLLPWTIAHGCAAIATGLALDGLFGKLLVPASHTLADYRPWGSSPLVDHLLSTERFDVLHHGASAARMDKISAIADWEPAQHFLRVCINEGGRDGVHNCGKCEKCQRTMAMLALCGKLDQFKTFNRPFGKADIARWTPNYSAGVIHMPFMRQYARRHGKSDYLLPLAVAHLRGLVMAQGKKLAPKRLFNFLKGRKYPYERDPFNPDHLLSTH